MGSYAWRFAYVKSDTGWPRYFALIGSIDPVGLYLNKADKLSYESEKWHRSGTVLSEDADKFIVRFTAQEFPTLGSNGFFARRKYLLKGKSAIREFFHIDTPYDLLQFHLDTYAVIKDTVIHDTIISLPSFLRKRINYMRLHYQDRKTERRYKVYDPDRSDDVIHLLLFVLYSFTFIQPLFVAIRGYIKVRDVAWFNISGAVS